MELFFDLMQVHERLFSAAAAGLSLSWMQAHALRQLQPGTPLPMRALAGSLACDASNVTGVVDKLEERGLIERKAGRDRRVKMLALTPEGQRLRGKLLARLFAPPPHFAALSGKDARRLADLLAALLEAAEGEAHAKEGAHRRTA
jgi:DNA-binding MarR family transcriptional regulator